MLQILLPKITDCKNTKNIYIKSDSTLFYALCNEKKCPVDENHRRDMIIND